MYINIPTTDNQHDDLKLVRKPVLLSRNACRRAVFNTKSNQTKPEVAQQTAEQETQELDVRPNSNSMISIEVKNWKYPFIIALLVALIMFQWIPTYRFLGLESRPMLPDPKKNILPSGRLRFDWTRLEMLDPLARRIYNHQRNCDLELANFRYRNRYGLGSDLHVWSQAICNALEDGSYRIRTLTPWIWRDESVCSSSPSSMLCYFPESELACPDDTSLVTSSDSRLIRNITRGQGRISNECPMTIESAGGVSNIRTATTVYLWSRVSPLVQSEAERQMRKVYPDGSPPNDLITVHIRWGDKKAEMKLVPIDAYVDAVHAIIRKRGLDDLEHNASIYLATEDPRAVAEFQDAAPSSWSIYVDPYFAEMLPYRNPKYNGNPQVAKELAGRPGLIALGSLLVAMEADAFVLTTASNWSRLLNELRKGILDPRCNNCTIMVDLRPGEY